MNKTFEPCRVRIDLDLPATESCEQRLINARELLHLLNEKVLGSMSVLYENDGGKVELADSVAQFKVHFKSEVTVIVQVKLDFIDGWPVSDDIYVVGVVVDKNPLARARDKAIGWWRQNAEKEGFDNVRRATVVAQSLDERGNVSQYVMDKVIFENGKEVT